MAEDQRPIIVVRRRGRQKHGHHGGAWKVAYADFVTAMMAFFLVMWLVGQASGEQKAAISEYFDNPSLQPGTSEKPAPGMNGPGGASSSMIKLGGTNEIPRGAGDQMLSRDGQPEVRPAPDAAAAPVDTKSAEAVAAAAEKRRLESLMEDLRKAVDRSQALKPFKDQLLLDITPEGLRIQVVDKENRPMFDLGSSRLKHYTAEILHTLAPFLNTVSNRISIAGHTDTRPYTGRPDYSNWELSADRANAARRALVDGGMDPDRVARVVGLADSVLFDKHNPHDPINRRISIVVLNKAAAKSSALGNAPVPE